ncbi:MAG: PAC2 family protein [Candidatus Heimdallarchaeota archaeon]
MEVPNVETLLEEMEEEENLRFLIRNEFVPPVGAVAIEILGYYGSVGHLVAHEIRRTTSQMNKLAGFFTNHMTEMVQLSSNDILLPITIQYLEIRDRPYFLATTNFAIPDAIGYQIAEELFRFYQQHKVTKILLVDGVYNSNRSIDKKPRVHKIASNEQRLEVTSEMTTAGDSFTLCGQIACSFLTYWGNNIPVEVFVVDTFPEYDPISSYALLLHLSEQWGFTGNFSRLEEKAQEFKAHYASTLEGKMDQNKPSDPDSQFFV